MLSERLQQRLILIYTLQMYRLSRCKLVTLERACKSIFTEVLFIVLEDGIMRSNQLHQGWNCIAWWSLLSYFTLQPQQDLSMIDESKDNNIDWDPQT